MKKLLSLLLAGLCVMALGSCGGEPARIAEESSQASNETFVTESLPETDDSHYPVTIQNYTYEKEPVEFTYEKAPERVVCIWTNSVENMLALGLGDKILLAAGVSKEEILPEYQEELQKVQEIAPQYPPKEDIVALEPDFILGWKSTFAEEKYWGATSFWNERGIGTYISLNSGLMSDQTIQNECEIFWLWGESLTWRTKHRRLSMRLKPKVESRPGFCGRERACPGADPGE